MLFVEIMRDPNANLISPINGRKMLFLKLIEEFRTQNVRFVRNAMRFSDAFIERDIFSKCPIFNASLPSQFDNKTAGCSLLHTKASGNMTFHSLTQESE